MTTTDFSAELECYRHSRGLDASSPEWDRLAAWFAETQRGETVLYAERLDRELARYRRDG